MPVVVVSSLTPASSGMGAQALELGAVGGRLCKPGSQFSIPDVRAMSSIRFAPRRSPR